MAEKHRRGRSISLSTAIEVSGFLWPEFVTEHGLVVLARYSGVNPCPSTTTLTEWEAFVNHTHVFDEFGSKSQAIRKTQVAKDEFEITYLEAHADFMAACELGRTAARLWALKLSKDFSGERFRVYYTEYDNPIVRFHKVRVDEAMWVTDEGMTTPDFRNALIYDTQSPATPICAPHLFVH